MLDKDERRKQKDKMDKDNEDGRNAESVSVDGSTVEEVDNFKVSWHKNQEW